MRAMVSIAAVLLCTNLVFLGIVIQEGVHLTEPLPDLPTPVTAADLALHLAGMPDYTGSANDACPDLARFIAALNATLAGVGVDSPPYPDPISAAIMHTTCRLDDPQTAGLLLPYRRLFRLHDLPPPRAFAHFVLD